MDVLMSQKGKTISVLWRQRAFPEEDSCCGLNPSSSSIACLNDYVGREILRPIGTKRLPAPGYLPS